MTSRKYDLNFSEGVDLFAVKTVPPKAIRLSYGEVTKRVLAVFINNYPMALRPIEIARWTGLKYSSVKDAVYRLRKRGLVEKIRRGIYRLIERDRGIAALEDYKRAEYGGTFKSTKDGLLVLKCDKKLHTRVSSIIKERLDRFCQDTGLSQCLVVNVALASFLRAQGYLDDFRSTFPVDRFAINRLQIFYVVSRPRRKLGGDDVE